MIHPNTASLCNVLRAQGVINPLTGQPYTEAMLLGIGGGLGAGYILWEFKAEDYAIIVMGFRNRWNYAVEYMTNLCQRIGAAVEVQETGSKKKAADNLAAGVPVVAWVDKAHLPYQHLPESLKGHISHVVGVPGLEGDSVMVDDLAEDLFTVPAEIFAAARARIGSDKNRLMRVTPPANTDLPAAIRAGIADCIAHLDRSSESFALPVYKKWAKLMTDRKNKKGWPVVFKERKGLYSTLRSIYEGITLDGTAGAGLRSLYADFLDEAAAVLDSASLNDAASAYRKAADAWIALADAALPGEPFARTRDLMQQRYAQFKANQDIQPVMDELNTLQAVYDQDFPLDDTTTLFEALQAHLETIYQTETHALNTLKETTA